MTGHGLPRRSCRDKCFDGRDFKQRYARRLVLHDGDCGEGALVRRAGDRDGFSFDGLRRGAADRCGAFPRRRLARCGAALARRLLRRVGRRDGSPAGVGFGAFGVPRRPGSGAGRVRHRHAYRCRTRGAHPGLAAPAAVAGCAAGTEPTEDRLHPGDPVERRRLRGGQHLQAGGSALGRHLCRGDGRGVQTRTGDLSHGRDLPRVWSRPRS